MPSRGFLKKGKSYLLLRKEGQEMLSEMVVIPEHPTNLGLKSDVRGGYLHKVISSTAIFKRKKREREREEMH